MTTLEMSLAGYEQEVNTLEEKLENGIKSGSEKVVKAILEELDQVFNKLPKFMLWGTQNYPLSQRIVDLFNKGQSYLL